MPTASPRGACTTSPLSWAAHGFRPGQCYTIALERLGAAVICAVIALIMSIVGRSVKWRVRYARATTAERKAARAESEAWITERRNQSRTRFKQANRKIAELRKDMRSLPGRGGQEAKTLREDMGELREQRNLEFMQLLWDIHVYRKKRRRERRLRRLQWLLQDLRSKRSQSPSSGSSVEESGSTVEGPGHG